MHELLRRSSAATPPRLNPRARSLTVAVTAAVLLLMVVTPQTVDASWLRTMTEALLFAYYAQCWNLSSGFTGLPSFGHPIFVGAGAYTSSLLLIHIGLTPWIGMFAGAGIAAAIGAAMALVTSRLSISSVYFALFTMAVWTVLVTVASVWNFLGGAQGLLVPISGGVGHFTLTATGYFYTALGLVIVAALVTSRLLKSRLGLGFRAYREDPDAAMSSGVNVVRTQVTAMVISASLAAFAGAFYAMYFRFISPDDVLGFAITETMILGTMVGGTCTVRGPIIGGFAFGVLGNELRTLPFLSGGTRGDVFTTAVYALLLVLTVRFLPRGIASLSERIPWLSSSSRGSHASDELQVIHAPHDAKRSRSQASPRDTITPVLSADTVSVRVGGLQILDNVSLSVRAGEILAVIGPNGAGKTTLFNCLSGFMTPTSGSAHLNGEPIVGSPATLFKRGLGRSFQIAKPFPALTARETVAVAARPFSRSYSDALCQATQVLDRVQFAAPFDTLGADLSNVNRKRLEVARALAGRPNVILLDEVCAGLSSSEVGAFVEIVRGIAADGMAILMVEHVLEAVVALADRVHVLDYGRTIAEGSPEAVMNSPVVAEAYLGHSAASRRFSEAGEVSR